MDSEGKNKQMGRECNRRTGGVFSREQVDVGAGLRTLLLL